MRRLNHWRNWPRPRVRTSSLMLVVALIAAGLGAWKAYWSPQRIWRTAIHQSDPAGRDQAWGAARSGRIDGLGPKASVKEVEAALEDSDPDTAASAVAVYPLIEPNGSVAASSLARRLLDPDPGIRRLAAASIRHVVRPDGSGRDQAVPPLIAALDDPDALVRRQAALSLGEIGFRVGHSTAYSPDEALRRHLKDGNRSVRLAAALAMARGESGEDAIPLLSEFLHTHRNRDCRERDCSLGFEALMVLAARSDRGASALIAGAYREGEGSSEDVLAAIAATVAGDHRARVRMVSRARLALADPSPEPRRSAALALQRIGEPLDLLPDPFGASPSGPRG